MMTPKCYELVMCIERKMKRDNNFKMVCGDIVRVLCETLKYPTLPFLTHIIETSIPSVAYGGANDLYLAENDVLQFQMYFCVDCGDYLIHRNMEIENVKTFECCCLAEVV
jgi:hypothetical protein